MSEDILKGILEELKGINRRLDYLKKIEDTIALPTLYYDFIKQLEEHASKCENFDGLYLQEKRCVKTPDSLQYVSDDYWEMGCSCGDKNAICSLINLKYKSVIVIREKLDEINAKYKRLNKDIDNNKIKKLTSFMET